jgi:hypothetical protein
MLYELRTEHVASAVLHGAVHNLTQLSSATLHGPGTPITRLVTLTLDLAQDPEYKPLLTATVALLFAAPSPVDAVC